VSQDPGDLPDVAVALITYNHAKFVRQSIESVFMQQYPGTIRLIVADDASTDGTPEEIAATVASAPSHVAVETVLREKNVGGLANLTGVWQSANASGAAYIALLEGDDYWTDPRKLADQVGYLEAHPSATMSFALAEELNLYDDPPTTSLVIVPPVASPAFGDLLCGNFVHTCTVLYRTGIMREFPTWFAECYFRDWPMHLVHAAAGGVHFLDRVVAVHRQHQSSKWWNPSRSERERITESETIQRLAVSHLGRQHNYKPLRLAAARQVWRARTSANRAERYLHLSAATLLDPARAMHKLRRRARSTAES
jgi:glycosyltransferase involved in cell wall biosynthesis